ncbi:MAG TPA: hypothetical protein VN905_05705 [Candidatus Binatia bacterium]|nr:hypothetical protein [Candidatus Binatia bacterium]
MRKAQVRAAAVISVVLIAFGPVGAPGQVIPFYAPPVTTSQTTTSPDPNDPNVEIVRTDTQTTWPGQGSSETGYVQIWVRKGDPTHRAQQIVRHTRHQAGNVVTIEDSTQTFTLSSSTTISTSTVMNTQTMDSTTSSSTETKDVHGNTTSGELTTLEIRKGQEDRRFHAMWSPSEHRYIADNPPPAGNMTVIPLPGLAPPMMVTPAQPPMPMVQPQH